MLSRWTVFLISDGEKTWRNRDAEFVTHINNRTQLNECWEKGWQCLFNAIDALTANDLNKIIYIRNEGHTVLEAINRQLAHYSYHVGQIVYASKEIARNDWKSLSIPKNKSEGYNQNKFSEDKKNSFFTDNL
jgi:hypothetical protein